MIHKIPNTNTFKYQKFDLIIRNQIFSSMEVVKKLTTCKWKDCIAYNNFKNRKPRVRIKQNLITWCCCNKHCNGTLNTNASLEESVEKGKHMHFADKGKIESTIILDSMWAKFTTETTPLFQIYPNRICETARTEERARTSFSINLYKS